MAFESATFSHIQPQIKSPLNEIGSLLSEPIRAGPQPGRQLTGNLSSAAEPLALEHEQSAGMKREGEGGGGGRGLSNNTQCKRCLLFFTNTPLTPARLLCSIQLI
ncbi:hypothetical protein EYF80_066166 [Liparis tanakae]|uniref:Uncharacterized protein n=1 Tax=Liparis tanakae TaxID=230148 RepID=A0A4Z2E5T8_9TELE|nr:hypothetical protein EYF80_066166 [Liparis tanakae]